MATIIVRFRVTDFDRWKAVFDRMAATREEHGIAGSSVHRDAEDPNVVVTILRAASLQAARAWGGSEALRSAMAEAGVVGPPEVQYLDDVE
jgi:quinol monooxygenase YgiN